MRNLILAGMFILHGVHEINGQDIPLANFSFPSNGDTVCLNEPVRIDNLSQNGLQHLWDFCPETFTETPLISQPTSVPGLLNGWGYKVVKHEDQWTGFLLSRNTNKLFRLEFGNNPLSQPTVFDLGNPGGLLVSPQGLDIVNQNGNWYGFVGKGETTTGQIVRLDFGTNIRNPPTAVGLGLFGLSGGRMRDLKVIRQDVNWILLIVLDTQNALLRVNYRESFSNSIAAENISTTGPLSGANLLLGFSVVKYSGNWIVHTVSFSNNGIQQYNFGADILGTPTFEGSFTFSSVARPYYIRVIQEADSFYGFVGNESKNLSIIKFGNFTSTPEQMPNATLPAFIGFDVLKSDSKNIIHGAVTATTNFRQVSFENTACPSQQTWAQEATPFNLSYHTPGTYQVELSILGGDAQSAVASKKLTVSSVSAPTIDIERDNICVDAPITFGVNSNKSLSDWKWDLGDNTISNDPGPVHQYNVPGSYTVTVEVRDSDNCANAAEYVISIYPAPTAEFVIPSTLLCTNNEVSFETTTPDTYDGNLVYQWFVDNNAVSAQRDLQYTFTTTGTKAIKLITSIPGCASEIVKTTSQVEAGPVVDFSFNGTCEKETYSFQNQISESVETYLWDFGNGNTSSEPNPTQVFAAFGDYSVSLTATNSTGCENVKTKNVAVHSNPVIDFSAAGSPNACSGSLTELQNQTVNPDAREITSWLWHFNDSTTQTQKDGHHIFPVAGVYNVSLSATTAVGCLAKGEKEVTIHASPSTDFIHTPACDDLPVLFTGPSGNDIASWYWEIGSSYYTTSSPTHTFKMAGDYPLHLQVTGTNGCIATTNRSVHVPVPLVPDFSLIKNCPDHEAVFTDMTTGIDSIISQEWSFGSGEAFSGSPLTYAFQQTGTETITLKVIGQSGCAYQMSKVIEVLPAPVAEFTADPAIGAFPHEVTFTNTSQNATSYLWSFSDGGVSEEVLPVYTFGQAGSYSVKLTASNEQECQDTFEAMISTVAPLPDADIGMISLATNPDGTSKLIITIHNRGNTILKNVFLDIDFSGGLTLRQQVPDAIAPGSKFNVVLNTGIVDVETLRYVCAFIELADDIAPSGNRACKQFEHALLVFPAYPNPATAVINLEWIAEREKSIRASLVDAIGRNVLIADFPATEGLNRQTLHVGDLEGGLYTLLLQDGAVKKIQRILISR